MPEADGVNMGTGCSPQPYKDHFYFTQGTWHAVYDACQTLHQILLPGLRPSQDIRATGNSCIEKRAAKRAA